MLQYIIDEQRRSFQAEVSSSAGWLSLLFFIFLKGRGTMKLEGQVRIPSGCAIAAVISKEGKRMAGDMIINGMKPMHDRSNGLGGGFAGYGIYPEYKEFYAFHLFFNDRASRKNCEQFLKERFEIVQSEMIPTRKLPAITRPVPHEISIPQQQFIQILITPDISLILRIFFEKPRTSE